MWRLIYYVPEAGVRGGRRGQQKAAPKKYAPWGGEGTTRVSGELGCVTEGEYQVVYVVRTALVAPAGAGGLGGSPSRSSEPAGKGA